MALIERIDVKLRTGNRQDAQTDGDVYLGVCGREFFLDTEADDFERGPGNPRTYTFGVGANVKRPEANDPRSPYQLLTERLGLCPAYIRFAPDGGDDHWNMESVIVTVQAGPERVEYQALGGPDHIWLGAKSGLYCYLFRTGTVG
jgi:hypothetical protein